MHKNKHDLLFDPCAFPSSCCIWMFVRSLKLKRPKNGRCDRPHTSSQLVTLCYSALRFSACFPSSLLHRASWFAPVVVFVSSCCDSVWTLFKIFSGLFFLKCKINSLLIWLIISWMNSNCQLILSGLPVFWLLLLQNINERPAVALSSERCRRASAVF